MSLVLKSSAVINTVTEYDVRQPRITSLRNNFGPLTFTPKFDDHPINSFRICSFGPYSNSSS